MSDPITIKLSLTETDAYAAALGDAARQRREHDRRVCELIEANNRAAEKRRAACALLREAVGDLGVSSFELESTAPFLPQQSRPDMLRAAAANRALASRIKTFLSEIHA